MQKRCQQCGTIICIDDWYEFIRRKYCQRCAADVARRQRAEYAKALRKKTREQNALTRELCTNQQKEIELLRAVVLQQRERLRDLEQEAGKK